MLVVYDWGGMIGFGWVDWYFELVERLIFFNMVVFLLFILKLLLCVFWFVCNMKFGVFLVCGFNVFVVGVMCMVVMCQKLLLDVCDGFIVLYDFWEFCIVMLCFVQDIFLIESDLSWSVVVGVGEWFVQFQYLFMFVCWGDCDFVFDYYFFEVWQ